VQAQIMQQDDAGAFILNPHLLQSKNIGLLSNGTFILEITEQFEHFMLTIFGIFTAFFLGI